MSTRFEAPGAECDLVETVRLAPGDALTVRTWQDRLLRIESMAARPSETLASIAAEPLSVPGAGAIREHAHAV